MKKLMKKIEQLVVDNMFDNNNLIFMNKFREIIDAVNELIDERNAKNALIAWAEDHYWDSLEKDRDLILLHLKQFKLSDCGVPLK
jgi:hypothetical protein